MSNLKAYNYLRIFKKFIKRSTIVSGKHNECIKRLNNFISLPVFFVSKTNLDHFSFKLLLHIVQNINYFLAYLSTVRVTDMGPTSRPNISNLNQSF
jgi:hypothetical protein